MTPIAAIKPTYSDSSVIEPAGACRMKGVANPVAIARVANISRRSWSAIHVDSIASATNTVAPLESRQPVPDERLKRLHTNRDPPR